MSAKAIQMYSGSDSVRAAEALRLATQGRRDEWPYVHVFPPASAVDVNLFGTAVTDTAGTVTEVLSYKVSAGKRFYLAAVILGANVAFNPGDALFTVDRNSPVGIANTQYMPEHGLTNVPVQLGSAIQGAWKLQRAREFAPLDEIRIKATNVSLSVGDPNYYVCGLFGWEIPTLDVKPRK